MYIYIFTPTKHDINKLIKSTINANTKFARDFVSLPPMLSKNKRALTATAKAWPNHHVIRFFNPFLLSFFQFLEFWCLHLVIQAPLLRPSSSSSPSKFVASNGAEVAGSSHTGIRSLFVHSPSVKLPSFAVL